MLEASREQEDTATQGNLPSQLTRLVGRRTELSELRALLWRARLLTICGPGGAGKTRLAAALAAAAGEDFVGGAWWIELAAVEDPALVLQAVGRALLPGESAAESLPAALAERFSESTLVVLDNCEQVIEVCGELAATLLARCPSLQLIATSRQPLGVPGEQVCRISGLAIAEGKPDDFDPALAMPSDAAQLFCERVAQASGPLDSADPATVAVVEAICARLEGMPLAIELAAARVAVLGVAGVAERLERDTRFLRTSSRVAPERHRTLAAALDWSHRLLEPDAQRLLRRIGVFRGSFSLAAVEAVCAETGQVDCELLDLLAGLVDRSLVQVVPAPPEPRYRLLAAVREYALGKLAASGEGDAVRRRHADFFGALLGPWRNGLRTPGDRWLERVELEHDNIAEALHWLFEHAPGRAAELALSLWQFWYRHGLYVEARGWLERLLGVEDRIEPQVRVWVRTAAGAVAFLQCDYPVAQGRLTDALDEAGRLGDRRATAAILQRLGSIAREQGRYDDARRLHGESLAVWTELGDAHGVASSENFLGFAAWLAGDWASAEAHGAVALDGFRRLHDAQEVAGTLVNLGACALYDGRLEQADERLQQALAVSRSLGFEEGIAWSQHELAILGRRRRRPAHESASALRSSAAIHRRLGDRWRLASALEEIAGGPLARRDQPAAVRLMAAADALRARLGAPVPPAEAADREAAISRLRSGLGVRAYAEAWAEGTAADLDAEIDSALAALVPFGGGSAEPPILTPRELRVLELLSSGATNREIGTALYISPSTAGVHVSNVLRKLGARRRADAAALAERLGLLGAPAGGS
ncbi:MAG TPA: tetratricopeptide repeat protein [Solirubrobacteraceae bacterium]|nr:tetratricopeptide repeat protein [Solirubrobacteraceae bacterium]